jgi:translation initiation factor eIF-2B subunit beta
VPIIDSLQGNLFNTQNNQNLSITDSVLKPIIIEAISEIIIEIETGVENIAAQSLEHIHANEVILTLGKSETVETFLKVIKMIKFFFKLFHLNNKQ